MVSRPWFWARSCEFSAPLLCPVGTSARCPHLTKRHQLAWNCPQRFEKAKDERAQGVFLDFCAPLMRKREFCTTPRGHILPAKNPASIWYQLPAASRILAHKEERRQPPLLQRCLSLFSCWTLEMACGEESTKCNFMKTHAMTFKLPKLL